MPAHRRACKPMGCSRPCKHSLGTEAGRCLEDAYLGTCTLAGGTWQHRNRPLVFTLNVRSHSCSGVSSAALFLLTPALFTAMSSPPSAATVSATILHPAPEGP